MLPKYFVFSVFLETPEERVYLKMTSRQLWQKQVATYQYGTSDCGDWALFALYLETVLVMVSLFCVSRLCFHLWFL